jgi:hypothetical protein
MRQWYPASGSAHPGPDWEWEATALPTLMDYGTQTRYGVPAPRQQSAPPAFSQQFCEFSRVTEEGNLQPGMPWVDFIVRIVGGRLTVIEAPVIPVFSVPADEVQIATPLWQRKIGTGSTLRLAGQLWSVEFVRVHQAEVTRVDRGGFLRMMFAAGTARKAVHRGREINERFTAALLAAGAADTVA